MAISKIIRNGDTLLDLTRDTVQPENLKEGVTAHAADGTIIHGELYEEVLNATQNGHYEAPFSAYYSTVDVNVPSPPPPNLITVTKHIDTTQEGFSGINISPSDAEFAGQHVDGFDQINLTLDLPEAGTPANLLDEFTATIYANSTPQTEFSAEDEGVDGFKKVHVDFPFFYEGGPEGNEYDPRADADYTTSYTLKPGIKIVTDDLDNKLIIYPYIDTSQLLRHSHEFLYFGEEAYTSGAVQFLSDQLPYADAAILGAPIEYNLPQSSPLEADSMYYRNAFIPAETSAASYDDIGNASEDLIPYSQNRPEITADMFPICGNTLTIPTMIRDDNHSYYVDEIELSDIVSLYNDEQQERLRVINLPHSLQVCSIDSSTFYNNGIDATLISVYRYSGTELTSSTGIPDCRRIIYYSTGE